MYISEAREILRTIKFLDFKFDLRENTRSHGYLTVEYKAPDTRDRNANINLNFMKVVNLEALGAKDFLLLVYDSVLDVLKQVSCLLSMALMCSMSMIATSSIK